MARALNAMFARAFEAEAHDAAHPPAADWIAAR